MTIKIYVSHYEEEVTTEKEFFEEYVPDEISSLRESDTFNEWLTHESNLTYENIFYLTEKEKEKVKQEYEKYLYNKAISNLEDNGWDWVQLEV